MTDERMDHLTAARYDDKIDAMYEAEYDLPHSVRDQQISWAWFERVDQEDKRNTERLQAYRLKRGAMDRLLKALHNALESMRFERST